MKPWLITYVLASIVLLPAVRPAQSQTYYFMNDSTEWKVDYSYIPGYDCYQCEYKYYFAGDTIINSMPYKKLRISTLKEGANFTDQYEGAIRQDTASKKVFFFADNFSGEQLIYDYSLGTGDTINSWLGYNWVIFSVDSILVGNQFHKRMNYGIGFTDTLSLIEGIGSSNGLLQSLADNTFESYAFLTCFTVAGNLLYTANQQMLDEKGCDVSGPVAVPLDPASKQMSVLPNPAHDKIQVISNLPVEKITMQNLYTMEVHIYTDHSGGIDVSNLSKGCYLMNIRTANRVFMEMLILQ